jgi:hypothetical protein
MIFLPLAPSCLLTRLNQHVPIRRSQSQLFLPGTDNVNPPVAGCRYLVVLMLGMTVWIWPGLLGEEKHGVVIFVPRLTHQTPLALVLEEPAIFNQLAILLRLGEAKAAETNPLLLFRSHVQPTKS